MGPYEKFLANEKAQIAKRVRQTPLYMTPFKTVIPKPGME